MISYVGGKKLQSKWICSFIPAIDTYVEVFGGAMWVYIAGDIDCNKAIYNDYNKYMFNLFTCCKEYDHLWNVIKFDKKYDKEVFSRCQRVLIEKGMNFEVPDFELASAYAYVSTHVFSGIVKPTGNKMANDNGNNPGSKYNAFQNRLVNRDMRRKFDKLETYNLSYEQIIEKVDGEGVLMYLDPPYYGTETYYSFHQFGNTDHKKLADILKSCKSKWVLSYYDFDNLTKWYPEDQYRYERKEYSKVSSSKATKTIGTEVLIMNY
jgi:DNA adenine methylase